MKVPPQIAILTVIGLGDVAVELIYLLHLPNAIPGSRALAGRWKHRAKRQTL
jgi:hypothetical protein